MGAVFVVVRHPVFDHLTSVEAVLDLFEVDCFMLQAAPQPFDEDVVEIERAHHGSDAVSFGAGYPDLSGA